MSRTMQLLMLFETKKHFKSTSPHRLCERTDFSHSIHLKCVISDLTHLMYSCSASTWLRFYLFANETHEIAQDSHRFLSENKLNHVNKIIPDNFRTFEIAKYLSLVNLSLSFRAQILFWIFVSAYWMPRVVSPMPPEAMCTNSWK